MSEGMVAEATTPAVPLTTQKGFRRKALTPEAKVQALEMFRRGEKAKDIARAIGVSPGVMTRERKHDEAFAAEWGRIQQERNRKQSKISAGQQELFLAAFAATGNEVKAAGLAGVSTKRFRRLQETDPGFALAYEDAKRDLAAMVLEEMLKRGVMGEEVPVLDSKGKVVGTRRTVSDKILSDLGKGLLPEMFAPERGVGGKKATVLVSINIGGRAQHLAVDGTVIEGEALPPLPDGKDGDGKGQTFKIPHFEQGEG